jgi:2-polyprenyl-3-methyl-5-hydroxy-6-metoxy-1,4-benzoquinol methylase
VTATVEQLRALTTAPADALEFVPCAVCGTEDVTLLHRKASPEGEIFPIVRCTACGLVYVNPRRRQETLTAVYRESGYYENADGVTSGYDDYLGDREILAIFFNRQLDTIERQVRSRGRLLDVGCAVGFLLDEARRRGWQTAGVELSEFASSYARQKMRLDVRSNTLREARYPAEHFDAIVMDDVVEHFGDPESELREAWRISKSGGVLLIHTPNVESPWYALMRKHWVHLKPGEHLYYFSPATLARLLGRAGFRVISTRPCGKATNLDYIVGRIKYYNRPAGQLLQRLTGRMPLMRRPFAFRSGEMETVAIKP